VDDHKPYQVQHPPVKWPWIAVTALNVTLCFRSTAYKALEKWGTAKEAGCNLIKRRQWVDNACPTV
jgi:hypothetical protein